MVTLDLRGLLALQDKQAPKVKWVILDPLEKLGPKVVLDPLEKLELLAKLDLRATQDP
jgi:hypothetical protein